MLNHSVRSTAAFLSSALLSAAAGAPIRIVPQAPPAPPPALTAATAAEEPAGLFATATVAYSIGEPSDLEQYYLELINRARANPTAEGARLAAATDPNIVAAYGYFGVDLALMQSELSALPPRPPLAFNRLLCRAARAHSEDLFARAFQGHDGSDGRTLGQRINAEGYAWTNIGENVFSYAFSAWHGHAGFEVDWGLGSGGMQPTRGHRVNIHGNFREIGIGVVEGTNTYAGNTVGPQLVTQDFASSSRTFVTGVAYYDRDADGFYTPGEGIGGLLVAVDGAEFYGVTAASGGYAVPVPSAAGARAVAFEGPGLTFSTTVTLAAATNAKVDLVPAYHLPVVAGSATPGLGRTSRYTTGVIGGATGYTWRRTRKAPAPDDSADSLAAVVASVSPSFTPRSTTVKKAGTASYHLAHPTTQSQILAYPGRFIVGPAGRLTFQSRLGWATDTQVAHVEASLDGSNWTSVYSQAGTGGAGETGFVSRSVSLTAFAGRAVFLRYRYSVAESSFDQTTDGFGWYIDQVSFVDLYSTADEAVTATTVPSFDFLPPSSDRYFLSVAPTISGRSWPAGPVLEVAPTAAPAITNQSSAVTATEGAASSLSVTASGATSYQWYKDGVGVAGGTGAILAFATTTPSQAGLYECVATGAGGEVLSAPVVLGVLPGAGRRTAGNVDTRAAWQNIRHPNGTTYDQFLLTGAAGTFTADPGEVARLSFLDSNDSIVQVEMSGAGAITVVLENATGPLAPALYNQPGIQYMKGRATLVLAGADVSTHFTIYSVGTATNPGVTRPDAPYLGWAEVAAAGITATDGKLGGIHQGNAWYRANRGFAGVYAPNVASVGGLAVLHEVSGGADARSFLRFAASGSVSVKIAGGSLAQPSTDPITVAGLRSVQMGAGQDSCGRAAPAQSIAARLIDLSGTDVTNIAAPGP